jgi:hypothetical protein
MEASVIVVVVMVVVDALCRDIMCKYTLKIILTHELYYFKHIIIVLLTLEIFGGLCFVSTFLL